MLEKKMWTEFQNKMYVWDLWVFPHMCMLAFQAFVTFVGHMPSRPELRNVIPLKLKEWCNFWYWCLKGYWYFLLINTTCCQFSFFFDVLKTRVTLNNNNDNNSSHYLNFWDGLRKSFARSATSRDISSVNIYCKFICLWTSPLMVWFRVSDVEC